MRKRDNLYMPGMTHISGSTCENQNLTVSYADHLLVAVDLLTPLQSQVAGHISTNGKSSSGMLQHPGGFVLKPAEKKAQRENEIRLYHHLSIATDPLDLELKEYVPKFYGTKNIEINGEETVFIILEDITAGMILPCVMDVKVGKQSWEPTASEEKIKTEKAKYVESRRDCGFCIPGMQFYSIADSKTVRRGKDFGKILDRTGMKKAFKSFLNWDSSESQPILHQFLNKLKKIFRWFQSQRRFLFYSSSLLLVYDAHFLHNSSAMPLMSPENHTVTFENSALTSSSAGNKEFFENQKKYPSPFSKLEKDSFAHNSCADYKSDKEVFSSADSDFCEKIVHVKMIDFAHTFISNSNGLDINYIEGLQNLISIFEKILEEAN